jgi:hypothetical protein
MPVLIYRTGLGTMADKTVDRRRTPGEVEWRLSGVVLAVHFCPLPYGCFQTAAS